MDRLSSLPPGNLLGYRLVLPAYLGRQAFDRLPAGQTRAFRLSPQGCRHVSVQRHFQPVLKSFETVTRAKVVVVDDVPQEDVESFTGGTPVSRLFRQSMPEPSGRRVETSAKLLATVRAKAVKI